MDYLQKYLNESAEKKNLKIESSADYHDSGQYHQDGEALKSDIVYKTGFANLDGYSPFYSGFYILGAVPSLGKTSFCLQLADQLAEQDRYVLYFSLEQSRIELLSKSIARTLHQIYIETTELPNVPKPLHVPAVLTRTKYLDDAEVAGAIDRYTKLVGERMHIISSPSALSADEIRDAVEKWIEDNNGVKPVVIVDYLQILRAPDVRMSDKAAVDYTMTTLKKMQTDNGITVLAISSLNRDNYLSTLDFSSFKETGGIEYGADVVWGLQLSVMDTKEFANTKDKNEKRKLYNTAKQQEVRKIKLVSLKNRYANSYYTVEFDYFPKYDFFMPTKR